MNVAPRKLKRQRRKNIWPFTKRRSPSNYIPASGGIAKHFPKTKTVVGDAVATFKGHQIVKRGRQFYVPSLDPGPFGNFDDAKLFIASITGGGKVKNPKRRRNAGSAFYGYHITKDANGLARVVRNIGPSSGTGNYYKTKTAAQKAATKYNKLIRRSRTNNPRTLIPAKIIIRGGKARVFVSASAMRKMNPSGMLHEYKVIFVGPTRNQMHAVYATTAGNASKIARKDKKHLFDRPRDWKVLSIKRMN